MRDQSLKAACLAAGLATAWAGKAHGEDLSRIEIGTSVSSAMTHAVLGFVIGGSGYSAFGPLDIPSGGFNQEVNSPFVPEAHDFWVLVGLVSPGHVAVSFSDAAGALSVPFETVFPGADEALIASQLAADDPAVNSFISGIITRADVRQVVDGTSTAVGFSDGFDNGLVSVSISEIPEPGAAVLSGVAVSACALRRRRD